MTLAQRVEAALVRAALALVRALPAVAASDLGGAVARTLGPLLPVSRVAETNLRHALPELDATARRRVIRRMWDNLGRTVAEFPHLPALRECPAGPGWEIEGAELLRALAARGGAAIFFSGHIGNWELLPPAAAAYGVAFASVYRAAKNPLIDAVITDLRASATGVAMPRYPKGAAGARQTLAHLAAGGRVAMLMDQKMNDGIPVPFFGRTAMTAPALAALALRFRCPVIPAHVERLGPARLRIIVEAPLDLPATGDRAADIASLTGTVNATLERWIRGCPEGWLWLHHRWPRPHESGYDSGHGRAAGNA